MVKDKTCLGHDRKMLFLAHSSSVSFSLPDSTTRPYSHPCLLSSLPLLVPLRACLGPFLSELGQSSCLDIGWLGLQMGVHVALVASQRQKSELFALYSWDPPALRGLESCPWGLNSGRHTMAQHGFLCSLLFRPRRMGLELVSKK